MLKRQNINNYRKVKWLDIFLVGHKGYVAGGCFKDIFTNKKAKDIDIFFENEADYNQAVTYFDGMEKAYEFYYENERVKAYKHIETNTTIELICYVYGTPEQVLNQFDFTIVKFAYIKKDEQEKDSKNAISNDYVLLHNRFFEHLILRRLVIDNEVPHPVSTFERMFRYGKYDYFPCRETKRKMIEALTEKPFLGELSESLYDGMD